jgi:hypothetical protein
MSMAVTRIGTCELALPVVSHRGRVSTHQSIFGYWQCIGSCVSCVFCPDSLASHTKKTQKMGRCWHVFRVFASKSQPIWSDTNFHMLIGVFLHLPAISKPPQYSMMTQESIVTKVVIGSKHSDGWNTHCCLQKLMHRRCDLCVLCHKQREI